MPPEILAILRKYGNAITPEALKNARAELNALGWHIQNEDRGDFRPRLQGPDGNVFDLGDWNEPWGKWVPRGKQDWGSPDDDKTPPPDDGTGNPDDKNPPTDDPTDPRFNPVPKDQNAMEFFLRGTPGYKFAFDEGQRAVQTSAASRGTLLTGGTLKALARFGTGLADQTYDAATRRYLSLADLGARTATAGY